MATIADLPERISSKIEPEPMSGCWLWMGWQSPEGYGGVRWGGKDRGAHRVVYELLVGPIPEGLELDHLCRNPGCVSPWHLDPVTHKVNWWRGVGNQQSGKTHCPRGHPYDETNTYLVPKTGHRQCIACRLARLQEKPVNARPRKPRGVKGEANGSCRISDERVAEMKASYALNPRPYKTLGAEFGITRQHATNIIRGLYR